MEVNDTLLLKDSSAAVIEKKTIIPAFEQVYNLEIEDNENYYVTEDGILVHNGYKNNRIQNKDGSYDLEISYKDDWTDAQKTAADAKIQELNNRDLTVSTPNRGSTSAADIYRNSGNAIPTGCDIDHIQDLQLGGIDDIDNMWPLDASVNRSLGSQINHLIKDLDVGTKIRQITIK